MNQHFASDFRETSQRKYYTIAINSPLIIQRIGVLLIISSKTVIIFENAVHYDAYSVLQILKIGKAHDDRSNNLRTNVNESAAYFPRGSLQQVRYWTQRLATWFFLEWMVRSGSEFTTKYRDAGVYVPLISFAPSRVKRQPSTKLPPPSTLRLWRLS